MPETTSLPSAGRNGTWHDDERIDLYPKQFREGFIRFSVGLEEPEDIIEDLDQALCAVGL